MRIGDYEIVRQLGKGGMSEVFEVEKIPVGSRHALKLFAYPKDDESVRMRFENEGKLLVKLNHPRIVRVTDLGVDASSGKPYFVMDLVLDPEGKVRSLADVSDGEADEETIGKWYDDIRDGLSYIHGKGVVHRDLKLQNIMIGADGHAIITDFGISRIYDPDSEGATFVDPVQTLIQMKSGHQPLMGSLGYMAPEIEMGVAASPQSDWYALGVIVYKLLTGVWCDARTDVVGTLATYDSVWSLIVPKLLHANPQGRECLSYAEEKAKDIERREFEWEGKWLKQKSRSHVARHVARYVGAFAVLLAVALGWTVHEFRSQRAVWQLRLSSSDIRPSTLPFDELFRIPAEARAEEQVSTDGTTTMYSRSQFEAARVDAMVLVHPTLAALEAGDITYEKAITDLEYFSEQLNENSDTSPFDNLSFGGNTYLQLGESEPLKMLLDNAIDKLRTLSED